MHRENYGRLSEAHLDSVQCLFRDFANVVGRVLNKYCRSKTVSNMKPFNFRTTESVISVPENTRELLQAEVDKKVNAIPDSTLPGDYASMRLKVPTDIRLGDNPLFEAYSKSRDTPKLD